MLTCSCAAACRTRPTVVPSLPGLRWFLAEPALGVPLLRYAITITCVLARHVYSMINTFPLSTAPHHWCRVRVLCAGHCHDKGKHMCLAYIVLFQTRIALLYPCEIEHAAARNTHDTMPCKVGIKEHALWRLLLSAHVFLCMHMCVFDAEYGGRTCVCASFPAIIHTQLAMRILFTFMRSINTHAPINAHWSFHPFAWRQHVKAWTISNPFYTQSLPCFVSPLCASALLREMSETLRANFDFRVE